ncbi:MAG: serine hydroxymethyltransferase [Arenicellales bacterium]|nr:serine hydroxymethyltransferase [Arenicellales bacterium]
MSTKSHFHDLLCDTDALVAEALASEKKRQQSQIELIASENMVSRAVLDALGHEIANKTLEGYPGNRFHGGSDYADVVEMAVIDRAKKLFDCEYVNAQPHSGTQANQAVFFALLQPGDRTLSLGLAAGGHLSHGAKPNVSGRWFDAHHYKVARDTGLIDYDAVERQAQEVKPKLLIAGGSAYPREFDFERMRVIADKVNAKLLVDMAHFAGLVAAGVHPSPIPQADIVTCTTTKTLRGPRGGLILSRSDEWAKKLQSAIFPGVQGSLHTQVIAAKAVCLGEALQPDFKLYGRRVKANAIRLAGVLQARGIDVISGGTDTHLVLLDLSSKGITGQRAQDVLYAANITSNKNPIPYDSTRPSEWVGLRLGTGAATTRGFGEDEFEQVGNIIADLIDNVTGANLDDQITSAQHSVANLCGQFPIYS